MNGTDSIRRGDVRSAGSASRVWTAATARRMGDVAAFAGTGATTIDAGEQRMASGGKSMVMRRIAGGLAGVVLLTAGAVRLWAADSVYTWTDAKGVIHITDRPPVQPHTLIDRIAVPTASPGAPTRNNPPATPAPPASDDRAQGIDKKVEAARSAVQEAIAAVEAAGKRYEAKRDAADALIEKGRRNRNYRRRHRTAIQAANSAAANAYEEYIKVRETAQAARKRLQALEADADSTH